MSPNIALIIRLILNQVILNECINEVTASTEHFASADINSFKVSKNSFTYTLSDSKYQYYENGTVLKWSPEEKEWKDFEALPTLLNNNSIDQSIETINSTNSPQTERSISQNNHLSSNKTDSTITQEMNALKRKAMSFLDLMAQEDDSNTNQKNKTPRSLIDIITQEIESTTTVIPSGNQRQEVSLNNQSNSINTDKSSTKPQKALKRKAIDDETQESDSSTTVIQSERQMKRRESQTIIQKEKKPIDLILEAQNIYNAYEQMKDDFSTLSYIAMNPIDFYDHHDGKEGLGRLLGYLSSYWF